MFGDRQNGSSRPPPKGIVACGTGDTMCAAECCTQRALPILPAPSRLAPHACVWGFLFPHSQRSLGGGTSLSFFGASARSIVWLLAPPQLWSRPDRSRP